MQRGFKTGALKKKTSKWSSGRGVFQYYNAIWGLGLIFSLCFVILSFSWTTSRVTSYTLERLDDYEVYIEQEITRTYQNKKKLPTPPIAKKPLTLDPQIIHFNPVPSIQENDEANVEIEEDITFQENNHSVLSPIEEPAPVDIIIEDEDNEPIIFADRRALFPACEGPMDRKEREICADKALLEYLSSNMRYPTIARENGIEGTCVVQFIVEKDGRITGEEIIKNIGGGCGEESLRVIKLMAENDIIWKPGLHHSRTVRMRIRVPVKFYLQK
jgi:protein TonB